MNNSKIALDDYMDSLEDEVVDNQPALREKEVELVAIIEAIQNLSNNRDWVILQEKVFDGVVNNLMKRRNTEVEKKPLNGPVIHSLNGQLEWAKKYSNIASLAQIYKLELTNVRKLLDAVN